MNEYLLEGFNPSQRDAVEYCDGPSLVIAGAGSGKTRVLTYKVAYLMGKGYEPFSILALTFTNKAANEMKERIAKIVGDEKARYLWMGTFHSIFLKILRIEHECIGFSSNFTIYDASDSKSLVKAIIKQMNLDDKVYKPSTVLSRISNAKNQLINAVDYVSNPSNRLLDSQAKIPMVGEIFRRYSERCRQSDAMDFDDILIYTYELFEKHPEVLAKYANRFKYVLVDEYQDTNYAQHRIIWQLTKEHQRVCVVGDDAQSIYSFRGANIDNILTFTDLYKDCKLFKLEQNYRSTRTIVDAANSLIHKNSRQIQKNVFSESDKGEPIPVVAAYSDVDEGIIVISKIRDLRRKENLDYSDFVILYRTNSQSRIFEEALRKQGYPYKIYGGLSFYQHKEIKDIIAYFRLAVNPHDEEAFRRVINYPARGIGNTTLAKIMDAATTYNVSLWTVINNPLSYGLNMTKGTTAKLQGFRDLIQNFIELANTSDAETVGSRIIKDSGISNDIYQDRSAENLSRQENVQELMNGLSDFCSSRLEEGNPNVSISDYLSEVSLLSDIDTDKGSNESKVTLMTIHASKGLEFNTVFVVGLEENLFPSQMAASSAREMEEERRLFYVAITRAEKHCFLTYSKSRFRYGKMEFGTPSRFLRDIDSAYLDFGTSGRMKESMSAKASKDVELPWKRKSNDLFATVPEETSSERKFTSNRFVPPSPAIRKLTPVNKPDSPTRNSAPMQSALANSAVTLKAGQRIEHDRFGIGIVEKVEGKGDSLKATVHFQNAGDKQLLLKFARFKILEG